MLGFLTDKERSHKVAEWAYSQARENNYIFFKNRKIVKLKTVMPGNNAISQNLQLRNFLITNTLE